MERTQEEIEEVVHRADETKASRYPGMSYEEGVSQALRWALGQTDDHPLDNE